MDPRSDPRSPDAAGPAAAAGQAARRVAVGVLSGLMPRRDATEIAAWLEGQPPGRRAAVTGGILAALAAGALLFAGFGWPGLVVYLGLVVFLVR